MEQIKKLKGFEPCRNCLFQHGKNSERCMKCTIRGCTYKNTHSFMACPLILSQLASSHASVSDAKDVHVTTNRRCCSVALPTLTAKVDSPTVDKSMQVVGVLLDTAAQQSLINREVVKRLGIVPIGQEYTTLVGFGMNKPMAKNYDVVKVKLIKS